MAEIDAAVAAPLRRRNDLTIRPTRVERVVSIPADSKLAVAALLLSDQLGREQRLRAAMLDVEGNYDLICIAAPKLSLVTIRDPAK